MNINLQSRIGINNAFRIARAKGHRIQCEDTYNVQNKAKKRSRHPKAMGCYSKTRKDHRLLDIQIRELDEQFEIKCHKAMYPSNLGIPSLDINCICAVLQRARWALNQDELETLKERTNYYGLNKSKDFEDFKNKYLNIKD